MLIVLNHKMNLGILEVQKYEKILRDLDVIVMPQIPYMGIFNKGMYTLGSQKIDLSDVTGGISAQAIKGMNAEYVLIGHFDQNDDDYVISKKIDEVSNHNLKPILCIGESKEDKLRNKGIYIIERKLSKILSSVKTSVNNIIIAYEPSLDSESVDIEYLNEVMFFIKSYIKDNYGFNVKVIYDGGVNSKNIRELLKINVADGFILEDSSLDIYEVINIYETING